MIALDVVPDRSETAAPGNGREARWKPALLAVLQQGAIAAVFVAGAVMLRGSFFDVVYLNPDEAELMGQARAAMRSPVPFTTWTTATTGPVWVLFLALMGTLGLPMTMAAAHLLAAALLGVLAYLGFALARRSIGWFSSAVITLFLWIPVVLILIGFKHDFAALNTELLPAALIMGAALVRPAALTRRPWLYAVIGLMCALAVGAKYQVAPLALAVLAVQVIQVGDFRPRAVLRAAGWWAAGAAAPAVILLLAMLLTPGVSWVAIRQNLDFLSLYSGRVTLGERLYNWRNDITSAHIFFLVLTVCWAGARSARPVQLCRAILVLAGLACVFAGGMGFGHYLYFLYAALAMAIGLPIKEGERFVPHFRRRWLGETAVVLAALIAWLTAFGKLDDLPRPTDRGQLATVFSEDGGAPRDPVLSSACPPGSRVMVWGWAPELYTYYSWTNAIPYMNTALLADAPVNRSSGLEVIREAIEDPSTACVVDAVGLPFFGFDANKSLATFYPEVVGPLGDGYRPAGRAHGCEACNVYVRR